MAYLEGLEPPTSWSVAKTGRVVSGLHSNDLQSTKNPVTPNVTPEEKRPILDALRGMDNDALIALLAEALAGK